MSDSIDALVIFGAAGDLAKLETFPAATEAARLLPGRDNWYDPAS
jgi:glucose-6-phosphate 1-dehydrogenase